MPVAHWRGAGDSFAAVAQLSDFELSWLIAAARMSNRTKELEAARAQRAKLATSPVADHEGLAPTLAKEA